jgi:nitroreductase
MQRTNPVIAFLMNHRSIRKFTSALIPEETIETILRAGTRAATAGGIRPYAFIVIDDPDVLKKISYIPGRWRWWPSSISTASSATTS